MLKAFQRRQLALIEHLLGASHAASALLALDIAALRQLSRAASERLRARYLEKRPIVEPAEGRPAFVGPTAQPSQQLRCQRICAPAGESPSTPSSTARSAAAF